MRLIEQTNQTTRWKMDVLDWLEVKGKNIEKKDICAGRRENVRNLRELEDYIFAKDAPRGLAEMMKAHGPPPGAEA